ERWDRSFSELNSTCSEKMDFSELEPCLRRCLCPVSAHGRGLNRSPCHFLWVLSQRYADSASCPLSTLYSCHYYHPRISIRWNHHHRRLTCFDRGGSCGIRALCHIFSADHDNKRPACQANHWIHTRWQPPAIRTCRRRY